MLVDGENVRRSRWPNLGREELVDRCRAWSVETGVEAIVVFDGGEPVERPAGDRCTVAGTGRESADEWLERRAGELRAAGRRHWLVTSDRALRAAAGHGAERTIGGGAFVRELDD